MSGITPIPPAFPAIPIEKTPRDLPQMSGGQPRIELIDTAQAAARNIRGANRDTRLSESEITDLLVWLSEGVTESTIISRFKKRYKRGISTKTIKKYRDKYAGRISEVASDLDRMAVETGLSKKANRIRSLQRLAEALEDQVFGEDGEMREGIAKHLVDQYRETLKLIAQESDGLKTGDAGDINFINVSNEELKEMAAGKLAANKDFAVILSEKAGVRAGMPKEDEIAKDKIRNQKAQAETEGS